MNPKPIKISNILKIADIEEDNLSTDFITWLADQAPTYKDTYENCNEHLYNVDDLVGAEGLTTDIESQLKSIYAAMQPDECSYFRVIKN